LGSRTTAVELEAISSEKKGTLDCQGERIPKNNELI